MQPVSRWITRRDSVCSSQPTPISFQVWWWSWWCWWWFLMRVEQCRITGYYRLLQVLWPNRSSPSLPSTHKSPASRWSHVGAPGTSIACRTINWSRKLSAAYRWTRVVSASSFAWAKPILLAGNKIKKSHKNYKSEYGKSTNSIRRDRNAFLKYLVSVGFLSFRANRRGRLT